MKKIVLEVEGKKVALNPTHLNSKPLNEEQYEKVKYHIETIVENNLAFQADETATDVSIASLKADNEILKEGLETAERLNREYQQTVNSLRNDNFQLVKKNADLEGKVKELEESLNENKDFYMSQYAKSDKVIVQKAQQIFDLKNRNTLYLLAIVAESAAIILYAIFK